MDTFSPVLFVSNSEPPVVQVTTPVITISGGNAVHFLPGSGRWSNANFSLDVHERNPGPILIAL